MTVEPGALPIAVDAMGGDHGPAVVVAGALLALENGLGPLSLVGDAGLVRAELERRGVPSTAVEVVDAPDPVGHDEAPARVARSRRRTPLHVGLRRVRDGEAAGFFSAGHSGAMLAIATLTLKRLAGCDRPAIAAVMPSARAAVVLLDAGANVECRSAHLVEFAHMGAAFAQVHLGRTRPTVGLLSNGTEDSKGTEVLREAHARLAATRLAYAGFIEGRDVPQGLVDVVVTDGFTGNVVLKLSEGIALALLDRVRATLGQSVAGMVGGLLVKRALRTLRGELDWAEVGGAPLLGVDGVAVVGHGASNAAAICSGIRLTRTLARSDLVRRLTVALADAPAPAPGSNGPNGSNGV
jgi:glycerol-3-phosphate acyltransferase PlsX